MYSPCAVKVHKGQQWPGEPNEGVSSPAPGSLPALLFDPA
jgi:hypothetical protein